MLDLSYKLYVRPHLGYGDVIYHNQMADMMYLIEQVQYKAALIVSGCWQGTSREKLYEGLGYESLSVRRWSRRMTLFYKIWWSCTQNPQNGKMTPKPQTGINILYIFKNISQNVEKNKF